MRSLRSCGRRMVVVDIAKLHVKKRIVAQWCYMDVPTAGGVATSNRIDLRG